MPLPRDVKPGPVCRFCDEPSNYGSKGAIVKTRTGTDGRPLMAHPDCDPLWGTLLDDNPKQEDSVIPEGAKVQLGIAASSTTLLENDPSNPMNHAGPHFVPPSQKPKPMQTTEVEGERPDEGIGPNMIHEEH
jgi:hypothetical protein